MLFPLLVPRKRYVSRERFILKKENGKSNRPCRQDYCCRTEGTYPGDLAISAVFYPETGHTVAIVLGCSERILEEFAGRIENSEDSFAHPLLLFGILIEIEKKRHLRLVDEKVFHLLRRVRVLSQMTKISSTSEITRENYSVDLWIEVSRLRIALGAWQQELAKIDEHISLLEGGVLARPTSDDAASASSRNTDASTTETLGPGLWRESAMAAGRRMQKRLREIKTEYDLKIQECTMVLDGMALSTQLVCPRISRKISVALERAGCWMLTRSPFRRVCE